MQSIAFSYLYTCGIMNIAQGMANVEVMQHPTSSFIIPCSIFIIQNPLQNCWYQPTDPHINHRFSLGGIPFTISIGIDPFKTFINR
jgi:hypothetical protein